MAFPMMQSAARFLTTRMLFLCLAGTAVVYWFLDSPNFPLPAGFTPIFWYLLKTYDVTGNIVLGIVVVLAYVFRREPIASEAIEAAGRHPWRIAMAAFFLLCLGSFYVYRNHALCMDEYTMLFQAKAFAAGRLTGNFPPELLPHLIPRGFQGTFFTVARDTGAVASHYWPGFALLLTPFAWAGIPWAANPLLGALSLVAVHRLALRVTGSTHAAAWALAFTVASPVFVASSISYYSMQAHFLLNAVYAVLLLQPSLVRAMAAGLIGSFALSLHQPVPHMLFAIPFMLWLAFRGGSWKVLLVLLASYLPLGFLLGIGWRLFLDGMLLPVAASEAAYVSALTGLEMFIRGVLGAFSPANLSLFEVRAAWLSKVWTWAAAGLIVVAMLGYFRTRTRADIQILTAALFLTFLGFSFVPFDQGHGWGFRYLHGTWFVLPVLAAAALAFPGQNEEGERALRGMCGWLALISLVVVNGVRLNHVDEFVDRHLNMVPPLAVPASASRPEVVFVNTGHGFYSADLVQNDPLLRGARIVMVQGRPDRNAELMARHFHGYQRVASAPWGEHWIAPIGRGYGLPSGSTSGASAK